MITTNDNPIFMKAALSSNVEFYVEEFAKFRRKTAEGILEMAHLVYQASQYLAPVYYQQFKKEIQFDPSSSSYIKLEKIGKNIEMLRQHSDKLPNAWTTIYHLAGMTNELFESAISQGKIRPSLTGAEAIQLANPNRKEQAQKKAQTHNNRAADFRVENEGRTIKIAFNELPDMEYLVTFYKELNNMINMTVPEAEMQISPSLEAILFGNEGNE